MSNGHGGRREGAGRKLGVPNKRPSRVRQIAEEAVVAGETPLEFMLRLMRDEAQPLELRVEMAVAAAPYSHPRLNALAVRDSSNTTISTTVGVVLEVMPPQGFAIPAPGQLIDVARIGPPE